MQQRENKCLVNLAIICSYANFLVIIWELGSSKNYLTSDVFNVLFTPELVSGLNYL